MTRKNSRAEIVPANEGIYFNDCEGYSENRWSGEEALVFNNAPFPLKEYFIKIACSNQKYNSIASRPIKNRDNSAYLYQGKVRVI